jgi:hypothetical protein
VPCLERSTDRASAEWQLLAIDVATGAERTLSAVHLPPAVAIVAGFSLHPDGTRFLTSVGNMPYDIWMLEGFGQQPWMLVCRKFRSPPEGIETENSVVTLQ